MDNKCLSVEKKMKLGGSCQVKKTGKTRNIKKKEKYSRCIEITAMCFCVILMAYSHNWITMERQKMKELKYKV